MQTTRHSMRRKRASITRVAVVLVSVGCILHAAHRERATVPDKYISAKNLSKSIAGESTGSDPVEHFQATAYCVTGITKSGVWTAPGCVASDPEVIPLGSMIYVDSPLMGGIYQVLDTGRLIKGKIIDIYIPDYALCREFGRRTVKVKVLRYGFLGEPSRKDAGI